MALTVTIVQVLGPGLVGVERAMGVSPVLLLGLLLGLVLPPSRLAVVEVVGAATSHLLPAMVVPQTGMDRATTMNVVVAPRPRIVRNQ